MFLEFEVNRRGGISGTNKSLFKNFRQAWIRISKATLEYRWLEQIQE